MVPRPIYAGLTLVELAGRQATLHGFWADPQAVLADTGASADSTWRTPDKRGT